MDIKEEGAVAPVNETDNAELGTLDPVNTEVQTSVEKNDTGTEETADLSDQVDYEELIRADILEIKREFPEARGISEIYELDNPIRYAALRDLGLSAREAYLATQKRPVSDTRRHLKAAIGRGVGRDGGGMSESELRAAREIFSGLSDSEIHTLYKRVKG